jgi:ABC-type glycerol-3-phosphate transport system substrate-binding protein
VSEDGRLPRFMEAAALTGIRQYFDLYPFLGPEARGLEEDAATRLFAAGNAAVHLSPIENPYVFLHDPEVAPQVRANLGVAALPGKPYYGGDNLVIWRHTLASPAKEQAAVALVSFLLGQHAQQVQCQAMPPVFPTRADALDSLPPVGDLLTQAVENALLKGQAYRPVPLWGRIEHQLGMALSNIGIDLLAGASMDACINKHLEPLERRLKLTLGS